MAIRRSDAPEPVRPKETVAVPGLGELVFRGISLGERFQITANKATPATDALLAATVIDPDDGAPLWSVEGWAAFSLRNPDGYSVALQTMMRINGLDGETNAGN